MPKLKTHCHYYILVVTLTVQLGSGCLFSPCDPVIKDCHSGRVSPSAKPENHSITWQEPTTKLSGVAMVIHGLNLKPTKMSAINASLTAVGIAVLQLSLQGHGQSHNTLSDKPSNKKRMRLFKSVSHAVWYEQALNAYRHAEHRSKKEGVPLFLVAYSYGGLLGADLFASDPSVQFDKMVLFSPAFSVTFGCSFKWLFIFPRLVIPSFAPRDYRANWGTPIAAYRVLFETIDHFKTQIFKTQIRKKVNVPTLVLIDPDDEMVSYQSLINMVRSENLTQWRIVPVIKSPSNKIAPPHHLIIDTDSLGDQTWNKVKDIMTKHLLSDITNE